MTHKKPALPLVIIAYIIIAFIIVWALTFGYIYGAVEKVIERFWIVGYNTVNIVTWVIFTIIILCLGWWLI